MLTEIKRQPSQLTWIAFILLLKGSKTQGAATTAPQYLN